MALLHRNGGHPYLSSISIISAYKWIHKETNIIEVNLGGAEGPGHRPGNFRGSGAPPPGKTGGHLPRKSSDAGLGIELRRVPKGGAVFRSHF